MAGFRRQRMSDHVYAWCWADLKRNGLTSEAADDVLGWAGRQGRAMRAAR